MNPGVDGDLKSKEFYSNWHKTLIYIVYDCGMDLSCELWSILSHNPSRLASLDQKKSFSHLYNTLDTQNYLEPISGVPPFHLQLQIIITKSHQNIITKTYYI